MLLPSHFQLEPSNSNSRTRVPAGGINLIASIDFGSDGATTATLSSSTKVSQGDDAILSAEVATPNHSNQQYSIYAITDAAANVVERYAYTAYGQPTILNAAAAVIAASAISNRYTYTAREWDATVGLYHFRARWMSGLTGRFLTRDPIGYEDGASLYRTYFVPLGIDPLGLNCWGLSGTPPFIPGAGGLFGITKSQGQVGFLGWEYTLTPTFSGEICKKDCGCGKTVEDMRASVEITGKGELFATTYGGSYGNEYFQLTYWAGLKVSGGIIGSGSLMFYTDNCNCPGKTLGGGCFEVGGTVSISGGGEGNVRIKLPWWAVGINPVGDARVSLYIQGRVNVTFRRCYECGCHKECIWKDRYCVSGAVTANAQISVDIGNRIVSTSASWTILKGETCTDLN